MAARSAAEHTVDALGLAALSAGNLLQRDALLAAQFELNRKLAIFTLTFGETLDREVAKSIAAVDSSRGGLRGATTGPSGFDGLSLVEDHEVEIQVSADRFALEIGHVCEWELRELEAYLDSALGGLRSGSDRNPIRPAVVGQAMLRAIEAVADRPDVHRVMSQEIGRSLAQAMRQTYLDIVGDMRRAGVKPTGLVVRPTAGPRSGSSASQHGALNSAPGALDPAHAHSGAAGVHQLSASGRLLPAGGQPLGGADRFSGVPMPAGRTGSPWGSSAGGGLGQVDPGLMSLIRRLSLNPVALDANSDTSAHPGYEPGPAGGSPSPYVDGSADAPLVAPNLIVAHREALRQAATGQLDHMVIDVVGFMFDQILSDASVPPKLAREIARLQLPVLRAALGDSSFFSSRRHPVRRFVNRIASLGAAFDDPEHPDLLALVRKVHELVKDVVEGDFEQIELYETRLDELERFVAELGRAEARAAGGADQLFERKEQQIRVGERLAQIVEPQVKALPVPAFLSAFLVQHWSRAIAAVELDPTADPALVPRMRQAGRQLVMSVQPKGAMDQRQAFLRALPQLMKDLNAGMDRIALPAESRKSFFEALMPAHAEALKGGVMSTLDFNLLARQADNVFATPVPKASELPPLSAAELPVLHDAVDPIAFTSQEAVAVGLVDEAAVAWDGQVDVDLSAGPELKADDLRIEGLPEPEPEPAGTASGRTLAEDAQIGFAYRMHLGGEWQKVRLTHVSPGRTFFVFTHGHKGRRMVSLTHRMLVRLCEAGRFRAFENAYLIERATARARRQLQTVAPRARAA